MTYIRFFAMIATSTVVMFICRVALKSETRRFRHRVLPLIARFSCYGAFASRAPLRDVIDCG